MNISITINQINLIVIKQERHVVEYFLQHIPVPAAFFNVVSIINICPLHIMANKTGVEPAAVICEAGSPLSLAISIFSVIQPVYVYLQWC